MTLDGLARARFVRVVECKSTRRGHGNPNRPVSAPWDYGHVIDGADTRKLSKATLTSERLHSSAMAKS